MAGALHENTNVSAKPELIRLNVVFLDRRISGEVTLGAPTEMDAVLEKLPLRIGAYVPDDLIEDWFAPGTGMNPVSRDALAAAEKYGRRFECEFKHYPERMEGVFWKWVPAV